MFQHLLPNMLFFNKVTKKYEQKVSDPSILFGFKQLLFHL